MLTYMPNWNSGLLVCDAVVLGEWIMKIWKDYNPSEHHETLTWNSVTYKKDWILSNKLQDIHTSHTL